MTCHEYVDIQEEAQGRSNKAGVFGCEDCMGRVRGWTFDAAIGVGVKRPDRGHEGIACKITWVGTYPYPTECPPCNSPRRGPCLKFEHFVLWDERGPDFTLHAPYLYRHMFEEKQVRLVMSQSLPRKMQEEVAAILTLADNQRDEVPANHGGRHPSSMATQHRSVGTAPIARKCHR